MSSTLTKLRQQPAWIALIIFIALSLWVASGMILTPDKKDSHTSKNTDIALVKVSVERVKADSVIREINLYGRTEPDRVATLRAEVKGLVTGIYVQEGDKIQAGQKIISLDKSDYVSRLASARATLKQRAVELKGAESLGNKGYQSQTELAKAQALLESAKAEVVAIELAIQRTDIIAPFDGIVNKRYVEVGDLLKDGDNIAMLVDLDPLIISANVTESNIPAIKKEQQATGRLTSGEKLAGKVRYISSVSEQGTNTFRIEVAVPNSDFTHKAGMSTELTLPLAQAWAIRITPSVLALDEKGNLGVKTVVDEHVKFVPIDIVKSDSQGVWLSGMGEEADIITLGHGFVRDGDKVEVVHTNPDTSL